MRISQSTRATRVGRWRYNARTRMMGPAIERQLMSCEVCDTAHFSRPGKKRNGLLDGQRRPFAFWIESPPAPITSLVFRRVLVGTAPHTHARYPRKLPSRTSAGLSGRASARALAEENVERRFPTRASIPGQNRTLSDAIALRPPGNAL